MLSGIPLARTSSTALVVPDSNSIFSVKPDNVATNTNLKNAVVRLIKRNKFDISTGYGKLSRLPEGICLVGFEVDTDCRRPIAIVRVAETE